MRPYLGRSSNTIGGREMLKRYVVSLIILACFTQFAAATISAQGNHRFVIRIPFDFVVPGELLPAGNYAIERVDPTRPNLLMFKNTDNGIVRLFITQRVENDETITASCLVFKRWQSEYQLFQVWVVGNKDGNQVPPLGNHKGGPSSVVWLETSYPKPKLVANKQEVRMAHPIE